MSVSSNNPCGVSVVRVATPVAATQTGGGALSEFGRRLRLARLDSGYSLAEFAQLIGVSKQAVTLWERNERVPAFETVWRIEVLLRQPVRSLVTLAYPHVEGLPPVDVQQAIQAASDLTIEQREGLLGVLRAYRGTHGPPD